MATPEQLKRRAEAQMRHYNKIKDTPEFQQKERERKRRLYLKLKQDVIDGYGGKCVCCGETTREFLCLDHVNGGGRQHRESYAPGGRGATLAIYREVRRLGYPPEYQLLCANCNLGKEHSLGCPHQRK